MSLKYTIITGASGAMGSEATAALARAGRPVIMACRDLDKAQAVKEKILDEVPDAVLDIKYLELSSLDAVREFAEGLRGVEISSLFNNAGTMERHFSVTCDGFERTLAVNFIAPSLLTLLLLPQIRDGVLNMVSVSCETARFDHRIFSPDASRFTQLGSYSTSKLALLFFSIALSQRCGLRVNVSDPGIVDTEMIRLDRWFDPLTDLIFRPFCNSPKKGASPGVRALLDMTSSTGSSAGSSEVSSADSGDFPIAGGGLMYKGLGSRPIPSKYASRVKDIGWLWEETGKILKDKGFLNK
jgi:NAD(P)-dependent dehydrogenase (short-subunit alcohol dehydrogenase family)